MPFTPEEAEKFCRHVRAARFGFSSALPDAWLTSNATTLLHALQVTAVEVHALPFDGLEARQSSTGRRETPRRRGTLRRGSLCSKVMDL